MVKLTDLEMRQAVYEQEKIKETLATEGARIIAQKFLTLAEETHKTEAKADPFTHPGEIVKARQIRYLIKTFAPELLEGMINFEADAPDYQVTPEEKWSFWGWIKQFTKERP